MQERQYLSIGEATVFGLGSGVAGHPAIVANAAIREKIRYSNIPDPLKGLGITFILTGPWAWPSWPSWALKSEQAIMTTTILSPSRSSYRHPAVGQPASHREVLPVPERHLKLVINGERTLEVEGGSTPLTLGNAGVLPPPAVAVAPCAVPLRLRPGGILPTEEPHAPQGDLAPRPPQ